MRDHDAEAKTLVATPRPRSRWPRVVGISLLLMVTHATAWGIGRMQGWWATRAAEAKTERLSTEMIAVKETVLRLEARRLLGQAQDSLDARNFGTAQQQVQQASRLLGASHPPPDLSSLAEALTKYQPVIAQDLAGQHQQLAGWIGQLDAQVPQQKP
jgi:hypothetical protein